MLKKARNITRTEFFRVSTLNTLNVAVKIGGGVLASLMIATFLGPAGMAHLGNLRNFLLSVDTFATLGFQNGIIKYVAEFERYEEKLRNFLTTLFVTILVTVVVGAIALLLLEGVISSWIFPLNPEFSWVIKVLAFILPLYTGNLIFMAVLSGLGNYRNVIGITIWGNVSGVLLSALLIWQMGIQGAFLGLIVSPLLQLLPAYYLLQKRFPAFLFLAKGRFDRNLLRKLMSYSLMSVVTAVLGSVVFISIRNQLLLGYGPEEAGYWEAVNRISTFYMMFATTLLSVYYLPALAASRTAVATAGIFKSYYKHMVPLFAVGLIFIFLVKHWVVMLVLSREFAPVEPLFKWQLAGDFLKVCSLILGYQFFARAMTRAYIISEVLSFAILYGAARLLTPTFGSEGAVMAHCITYTLYLGGLLFYFRRTLLPKPLQA